MLKTLLTLRLLISFVGIFWFPLIGLGAILNWNLQQAVDGNATGKWTQEKTPPMLHLKKVDEERIRNGLPVIR